MFLYPLIREPSAAASTLAYSSANTASIRTPEDDDDKEEVDDGVVEDREEEDVFSSTSKEDLTYESDHSKLNDELDNPFQVAAQIVKGPVSVSTLVGSTVLLEALIIGRPEPAVRWLKGVRPKQDFSLSLSLFVARLSVCNDRR